MINKKRLRHELTGIRNSLSPKNSKCFGYLNTEIQMLTTLIHRLYEEKKDDQLYVHD